MESVEEVKEASERFTKLQDEAELEGEEMHADILDTSASLQNDLQASGQQYRWCD